jgi:hypothetical protein
MRKIKSFRFQCPGAGLFLFTNKDLRRSPCLIKSGPRRSTRKDKREPRTRIVILSLFVNASAVFCASLRYYYFTPFCTVGCRPRSEKSCGASSIAPCRAAAAEVCGLCGRLNRARVFVCRTHGRAVLPLALQNQKRHRETALAHHDGRGGRALRAQDPGQLQQG